MQHFVLIAVFQRLAKAKKPKIPTPERQNFNCRELSRLALPADVFASEIACALIAAI
jgi:hypothetical protein